MKTKRKYAHELYPHNPSEHDVRPLNVEVTYLYAQAIGLNVWGTGWFDAFPGGHDKGTTEYTVAAQMTAYRTLLLLGHRRDALLADALHQGFTGQEAWTWAESRMDEEGSWIYERAVHHGVDVEAIRPYPCGPEPDHHDHYGEKDSNGFRGVKRAEGPESECVDCCEPIDPREPSDADVPLVGVPG